MGFRVISVRRPCGRKLEWTSLRISKRQLDEPKRTAGFWQRLECCSLAGHGLDRDIATLQAAVVPNAGPGHLSVN